MSTQASSDTLEQTNLQEPPKYTVTIHDDDRTPFEFVTTLLRKVFGHTAEEADETAQKINKEGAAVAGVYFFEAAEEKATQATKVAKQNTYPLKVTFEPEK